MKSRYRTTGVGWIAGELGRGLVAGALGTAAMTASSHLEQKMRGRPESTAPATAAINVLHVTPDNKDAEKGVGQLVHWQYGTALGTVRTGLGLLGLPEPVATLVFFGLAWGGSLVMVPRLAKTPPPSEWEPEELAIDAGHHLVYALATGLALATVVKSRREK